MSDYRSVFSVLKASAGSGGEYRESVFIEEVWLSYIVLLCESRGITVSRGPGLGILRPDMLANVLTNELNNRP